MTSVVGTASASGTSITLPAHQPGDLILVFAFRDDSTTPPGSPGGLWVTFTGASTGGCAVRVGRLTAQTSSEVSGTYANAKQILAIVFRPDAGYRLFFNNNAGGAGTTNTISFASNTFVNNDGTSWLVRYLGHMSNDQNLGSNPPPETFTRIALADSLCESALYDSNGGWTGSTAAGITGTGTAAGWVTFNSEVRQQATTAYTKDLTISGSGAVALANQASKVFSIASASALSMLRSIGHVLPIPSVASVSRGAQVARGVFVSSSGSILILRQWPRALAISSSGAVSVLKSGLKRSLIAAPAVVTRQLQTGKRLVVLGAGVLSFVKQAGKVVVITCASALTQRLGAAKSLLVASSSGVVLEVLKARLVNISISSVGTVTMLRQTSRTLIAATSVGTVSMYKSAQKQFSTAISSAVSMLRVVGKVPLISSPSSFLLSRQTGKRMAISAPSVLTLRRACSRSLTVVSSSLTALTKSVTRRLSIVTSTTVSIRRSYVIIKAFSSASIVTIRKSALVVRTVNVLASFVTVRSVNKALLISSASHVLLRMLPKLHTILATFKQILGRVTISQVLGRAARTVTGKVGTYVEGKISMEQHEPLEFLCGTDWQLGGPLQDANNAPLNLSGASITWKLDSLDGGTNFITCDLNSGIVVVDATTSTIVVTAPNARTLALSPGAYRDYLIVTLPGGQKLPMWTGIIRAGAAPA